MTELSEQQRTHYLSLLGIDSFVARKVLPNAQPSMPLEKAKIIPQAESLPGPVDNLTTDSALGVIDAPEPLPSLDDLTAAVDLAAPAEDTQTPQEDSAASAPSIIPAPSPAKAPTTDSTPLRFALNCWRIHQDLLIVDSREPGSALPTDRLLLNIVRSLGFGLVQLPSSDLLRWPLFDGDQAAGNPDEAGAMVQAYLSAALAKQPAKLVVLMGQNAIEFGLNQQAESMPEMGNSITIDSWQTNVAAIPSLVDMLRDPSLKRIAWQALKPFANRA